MRTSSPEHGRGRAAFGAYFLGAVLPLVALGFVLERHVLPGVSDRLVSLGLVGLALSLTVLSLGSFFALRRTTLRSIARMDRDNRHLAGPDVPHAREIDRVRVARAELGPAHRRLAVAGDAIVLEHDSP